MTNVLQATVAVLLKCYESVAQWELRPFWYQLNFIVRSFHLCYVNGLSSSKYECAMDCGSVTCRHCSMCVTQILCDRAMMHSITTDESFFTALELCCTQSLYDFVSVCSSTWAQLVRTMSVCQLNPYVSHWRGLHWLLCLCLLCILCESCSICCLYPCE